MNIQPLIRFIKERESIRLKREQGKPSPWTTDPILQKYRFTNVERERDRVTIWIRDNLRNPLADSPSLVTVMVVARLINRIETLEVLKDGLLEDGWQPSRDIAKLETVALSGPITNSAYMVTTPEGKNKAHGLSFMIDSVQGDEDLKADCQQDLREVHEQLTRHPRIGSFLAAQVVADLKYTPRFSEQEMPDWWTFAASGPGSQRGLNRILGRPVNSKWEEKDWHKNLTRLRSCLLPMLEQFKLPRLHAQDVQNCCCEYDKMERARLGEGEPKQLFKPWKPMVTEQQTNLL